MKKPLFNRVAIVGVGLIGGSLGLAIKKRRLARFVVGVARRKASAIGAVSARAVDMATLNLKEGVQDADLVILAGPVSTILRHLALISRHLKRGSLVIDVGSSKEAIHAAANKFLKKNIFVGCHPMAGSEKCGIAFADGDLFERAVCFVTGKSSKVESFWKSLGSKPIFIRDREHDAWVAKSSHLPHALSFSLFQKMDPQYPQNPSLKEMARLSRSHPRLWVDIFLSNRAEVLKAAGRFGQDLSYIQKALRAKNKAAIDRYNSHANKQAS